MWRLCPQNGSSLPLGWKLCWTIQPQVFHSVFVLFISSFDLIQTGLLTIFFTVGVDFFMGQPVIGKLGEIQQLLVYSSCIASGMLGLAIGFLFCTQIYGLAKNVTTIESFTEFMMEREPFRK